MANHPDDKHTAATIQTIERFNEAFNRHDVDAVMALMTDDCLFEDTAPPDGQRYQGQAAVRALWERFFHASPQALFETEELWAAGAHCLVRWVYRWQDANSQPGHVRGVDLFQVRDDKVAEKLSYVKG